MKGCFARRMENVHRSFIREILHFAADPRVISFAGGLPNPDLFPIAEIQEACVSVLQEDGRDALQYSTSEGYLPLRQLIAERYRGKGLSVSPDEVLITTGSQQGLDLIAKVLLNEGDGVLVEQPGYLGAIQAFSLFMPRFHGLSMDPAGIDPAELGGVLERENIKLFYAVPNFQNPSGITYSETRREEVARILRQHDCLFIEDDPYGELRFMGRDLPSFRALLGDQALLLGSFSKIVVPSFRLGWVCAPADIMEKLLIPKQAADLHTNYFCQRVIHRYLETNDVDAHIRSIRRQYRMQRDTMVKMIERTFPDTVEVTRPEGGMFLWVTLPEGISSMELLELSVKEHVAFVPGKPFFINGRGENTLRLNFSNVDERRIEEGITRLAAGIKKLLPK